MPMDRFLANPAVYNKPIRIGSNANPYEVISAFFTAYTLSEVRSILWGMAETVITSGTIDNERYSDPKERVNVLYQYNRLEELAEAAWLINQARNPSSNTAEAMRSES
jgi:hypothetical protein